MFFTPAPNTSTPSARMRTGGKTYTLACKPGKMRPSKRALYVTRQLELWRRTCAGVGQGGVVLWVITGADREPVSACKCNLFPQQQPQTFRDKGSVRVPHTDPASMCPRLLSWTTYCSRSRSVASNHPPNESPTRLDRLHILLNFSTQRAVKGPVRSRRWQHPSSATRSPRSLSLSSSRYLTSRRGKVGLA